MSNVTLIGMSGAGKSTVGKVVAQQLDWCLYDVDHEMEKQYDKSLQDILDELGDMHFLQAQEKQVTKMDLSRETVISPGGSVVYSLSAMQFLKRHSTVVYLRVDLQTLLDRLTLTGRGIVGLQDRSFADLFAERQSLYNKYADITIGATAKTPEEIAAGIKQLI